MKTIQLHQQRFEKKPNTKTAYMLTEEHTEEITEHQYNMYLDSIGWFRRLGGSEKTQKGYTSQGYKVVKLTSTSPDKEIKVIRKFNFDEEDRIKL